MTIRTVIHADNTCNDQTGIGGWVAVVTRNAAGRQNGPSSYEMERKAMVEAVKMGDGPCTILSDHEGIVGLARDGRTPRMCRQLWEELYAAAASEDVMSDWQRRDRPLGSRLAHQLSREAAPGRQRG